ncbi:hypothetical protein AVEN_12577-1 [Araneus ventricosus]|uniref:Uncharacterized protein n=1 Tax=Araneus ventricosus TaxID=182803 RepID=A0A4Y2ACE1_ARAVE|nr:hypothetical protein AVEN_12577-1 [Araneus ventricosus]
MKSLPVEKYKRQALKPRRVSWILICKQAALSAYEVYLQLNDDHWKDIPFMYGLGMVYFHYNEHYWYEYQVLNACSAI